MSNRSPYHTLLHALQDTAVRDLAWVIGSPGLVEAAYPPYAEHVIDDAWCIEQLKNSDAWLNTLDKNPADLPRFIAARPTRRLGHYFETLIKFWLSHHPDIEIIATNLQVMDASRTMGEYDLLIRTLSPCGAAHYTSHWEVAVKFYLQTEPLQESWPATPDTLSPHCPLVGCGAYLGPGGHDRLDLKLARIFQHQLRLGDTASGLAALPDGVTLDKTQAFIKGYLFYTASSSAADPGTTELPGATELSGVSTSHLSGWWIRHGQMPLPQYKINTGWIILPRLRWLAPVRLAQDAAVQTYAGMCHTLTEHFKTSDEALLLVALQRDQENIWHEETRGFVVHKQWPERHLPLQQ